MTPGLLDALLPPRTWWQWLWGLPRATYELHFGLWLNRMDVLYQRIYAVYVGTQWAMNYDDLPVHMWLAVTDTEDAAFDLWSTTNNRRIDAKIAREGGGNLMG